jgi:multiple RNA-binding domain-containing protein 1
MSHIFIAAIVEFAEPAEARNGFKNVAYSKLKGIPMYLEWAPMGVFDKSAPKKASSRDSSESTKVNNEESTSSSPAKDTAVAESTESKSGEAVEDERQKFKLPTVDDDEEDEFDYKIPEPETTLFVKNVSFKTTEEQLKKVMVYLLTEGHWNENIIHSFIHSY